MEELTLRQGDVTANLSNVSYRPPEGFQEDNTWHVAEESISAESDTMLANGPATIRRGGNEFPVVLTVLEPETLPGDNEEGEDGQPACDVEIGCSEDLPKVALALGLLDHLTPKQQRAILHR